MEERKSKIISTILIILAWLIAMALVYLVFAKLDLVRFFPSKASMANIMHPRPKALSA
jgi:hypothetical protein